MQEAGANRRCRNLAFTLADGLEYVRAACSKAAWMWTPSPPRLSFFFGYRHELSLWRSPSCGRHGCCGTGADGDAFPAQGSALVDAAHPLPDVRRLACTEQDPYNNVVRTTYGGDGVRCSAAPSRLHTNALRRGAGACRRKCRCPHRTQHPADPGRGRNGCRPMWSTRWAGSLLRGDP